MPKPIHDLPPDYHEAEHLVLLEPGKILRLNLLALIPLVGVMALLDIWWWIISRGRAPEPGGFGVGFPWWLWLILMLVVSIPIHEWLHGLAIRWAGQRPRYGVMWSKGAFYATADGALFQRNVFVVIALAPIVGITLLAMLLLIFLPDTAGYYVGWGAVLNAANAIGDLWMTTVALRYPADALVRDEADSIRIYTRR